MRIIFTILNIRITAILLLCSASCQDCQQSARGGDKRRTLFASILPSHETFFQTVNQYITHGSRDGLQLRVLFVLADRRDRIGNGVGRCSCDCSGIRIDWITVNSKVRPLTERCVVSLGQWNVEHSMHS